MDACLSSCLPLAAVADFFEDSFAGPAQAYVKVCSAVSEASLSDAASEAAAAVPASQQTEALPAHGPTLQRRSMTCAEEIVRTPSQQQSEERTVQKVQCLKDIIN